MKVYRIIVLVVAIILGISLTALVFFGSGGLVAIKEPVTEEYYDFLKENALNVAKTLDKTVITDETLTADFYFNEDELVVTVSSMKAKLTAKFPISNYSLNIENGTFISKGTAEFENVEYIEQNKLEPVWLYIVGSIILGAFLSALVYMLFFEAWFSLIKVKKNI